MTTATPKPVPCRCPIAAYPHRPDSIKGCEHNARQYDEFMDRVYARMDQDSARAIKTIVGALGRAERAT